MADDETPTTDVAATAAPPPPPNRAARRKAAKTKRPPKLDQSVRDAIDRAKHGQRQPTGDGLPDGAQVLEPTPEQIAQAEAAAQAAAAGFPPTGGGDTPPLDPSQMSPELLQQLAAMTGGGAQAGGAAAALAKAKRRHKKYVDLEAELAVFLMMPAAPCEIAGDNYCAMHFVQQGPLLAHRLTAYAETHDATFELLSKIVEAGGMVALIVAVAAYALPPMLHHGLPAPEGLRRMYGVPQKTPAPAPQGVDDVG
jgi:hypothetical protein